MWTTENRSRYDRSKPRYPSDLPDEEWAVINPLIPAAKRSGNKRTVDERELINGPMYILNTGCQWAASRKDCRRVAQSMPTSAAGTTTGRWIAFIMPSIFSAGS